MTAPVPDAAPAQSAAGDEEMIEHFMQALDEAEGRESALTVPDKAVEAAASHFYTGWDFTGDDEIDPDDRNICMAHSRRALEAAAPFIVAANQPEPPPEIECPNCNATIRARMADQGEVAEVERLRAQREAVLALAETWRYKGEFGWGAWQEGHGPDQEGCILDAAATTLRRLLGVEATQ